MGENLAVPGRLSVRTPMQWSGEPGAGFSSAAARRYVRPLPAGTYGPLAVNVAAQRREPDSLLNWMERVIRRRRETPEIGWGTFSVLDVGASAKAVLAHRCDWESSAVVALHNLDPAPVQVQVDLGEAEGVTDAVDLLDGDGSRPLTGSVLDLTLEGYGHRWFRLRGPGTRNPP